MSKTASVKPAVIPLLALIFTFTVAQPGREASTAHSNEMREVMLPVTVRDRNGVLVEGLRLNDFEVIEENVPQRISSFGKRSVALNIVLLIDTSGSAAKELEDFKQAAQRFVSKLEENDRISLIKFDDRVELVLDWTPSRSALKRGLDRVTTGTYARFYDALWLAAHEQLGRAVGRKALILLTDGIDSGRGLKTAEQALTALIESEAAVYVISKTAIQSGRERGIVEAEKRNPVPGSSQMRVSTGLETLKALQLSERWLQTLADETGGRNFLPENFSALENSYQQISQIAQITISDFLYTFEPCEGRKVPFN